jgi:hypothetical protein
LSLKSIMTPMVSALWLCQRDKNDLTFCCSGRSFLAPESSTLA